MPTNLEIINLGLGKLGSSRVATLDPATTPLAKHVAAGYTHWKRDELTQRVWVFALEHAALELEDPDVLIDTPADGRKYKYELPDNCLQPIRERFSEWEQRGSFIYSAYSTLTIPYIRVAGEDEFVPSFVEVLACRVGKECVEFVTQSNTKDETIEIKYDKAILRAFRQNAWVVGSQDVGLADENSEWVTARW